ncbi:unnamed protein product [Cunninghamella blakesleeana]
MGTQQSRPKKALPSIKTSKSNMNTTTTKSSNNIPKKQISNTNLSASKPMLMNNHNDNENRINNTNNEYNKNKNLDDGNQITSITDTILNRFVEPPSLSINDYLDQHAATDFFIQDTPDFYYDVQSTVSSNHTQFTALFSTLSSIGSSTISSVSSLSSSKLQPTTTINYYDQSTNLQQWNNNKNEPSNLIQDISTIKTIHDLIAYTEKNQNIELAYYIAICYYNGTFNNHEMDIEKSIQWFEKVIMIGEIDMKNRKNDENKSFILSLMAESQYRIGKMLLPTSCQQMNNNNNNNNNNEKKAWSYIEMAAKNENSKAEFLMGWMADKKEKDLQKAIHWYISSWRHGLLEAQTALGCLLINHAYKIGDADLDINLISSLSSVLSRDQQALSLLQDAADKNELNAILRLGNLYLEGKIVEKNITLAITYFDKTFKLVNENTPNYQIIHYIIGREYRYLEGNRGFDSSLLTSKENDGITHYHQKALQHFNVSVKSGFALAQRSLAHMLLVDQHPDASTRLLNRQKAFDLFHQAAEQDDITAMGFLGDIYENGIGGMKPDWEKAMYYYQKAAKLGSTAGEYAWARLLLQQKDETSTKEAFQLFNHIMNQSISIMNNTNDMNFQTYGQNWQQIQLEHKLQRFHCKAKFMIARYKLHGWPGCTKNPKEAFQDLLYLTEKEHYGPAYYWVGICYKEGITIETMTTAHSSSLHDHPQSHLNKKEMTLLVQPDLMRAYVYFKKGATLNNDLDCQLVLAKMCRNGFKYVDEKTSVTKTFQNQEESFQWYEMAATQHKNHEALYSCGIFYEEGLSPIKTKQVKKAQDYYEASAKQGYEMAMIKLSQLIIKEELGCNIGDDNNNDDDDELININNHINSIKLYHKDLTMIHYSKKALYWLSLAANKNNADAYLGLATIYEKNCQPDSLDDHDRYAKGLDYLNQPLLLLHPKAWCIKSKYYEYGWSIEQDLNKALYCLEKAESLNHSKAGLLIGKFLARNGKTDVALIKYKELCKKYPLRSKIGWYARLDLCKILIPLCSEDQQSDIHRHQQQQNLKLLDLQSEAKMVFQWLVDMTGAILTENAIEPLFLSAWCYECGIGVTENLTKAKLHYEKAISITINNKINWSQQNAYFRLAKLCVNQQLYEESFKYFKLLELNLDNMNHHSSKTRIQAREIRYYLGYLILNGLGTTKNEKEGMEWLIKAADEGYGEARYLLGLLYLKSKKIDEARKRFEQGVAEHHSGCMLELALLLEQEHQGDLQWEGHETYELLERARELGDPEAMVRIAIVKQYGLGTAYRKQTPPHESLYLYREAAQKGHPKAAVYAAIVYHEMKEFSLAVNWFKMQPDSLISQVWLAFYQLKGVGGLTIHPSLAFHQLLKVATTFDYDDQKDIGDLNALELAYLLIGRCYEEGEGTEKNDKQAMVYYGLAKQKCRNTEATYRLGALLYQQYDSNNNNNNDHMIHLQQKAFECFDTAASKGHLEAKYMVGVYHARGLGGMMKDKNAARIHLQKAVKEGHTRALLDLGHLLWSMKKYNEALDKFKEASKLNVPEASYQLGVIYHHGEKVNRRHRHQQHDSSTNSTTTNTKKNHTYTDDNDNDDDIIVEQNYHKAFDYFMIASQQGHFNATMMIGTYYEEGLDSAFHPKDLEKALSFYELAYSISPKEHMVELAIGKLFHLLANGSQQKEQINHYHQLAFDWFKKASPKINEMENNNNNIIPLYEAQMMIAFYYLNGWGPITKQPKHGFELLLNAAENGYTDALMEVAECYEKGLGTEKNLEEARRFLSFAADMNLVEAMDKLGIYHRDGLGGLISDKTKADEWENKANMIRNGDLERDSSVCTTSSTATY